MPTLEAELKASEKRCEDLANYVKQLVLDKERLRDDIERLRTENKRLETDKDKAMLSALVGTWKAFVSRILCIKFSVSRVILLYPRRLRLLCLK